MRLRAHNPFRRDAKAFGLGRLVAMLAMWGLLLAGAMPMAGHAMSGGLPGAAICTSDGHRNHPAPAGSHDHDGMCPACCLVHCHAQAVLLTPGPWLRPPLLVAARVAAGRPGARAPPGRADGAAYPRGPPTLA